MDNYEENYCNVLSNNDHSIFSIVNPKFYPNFANQIRLEVI